MHPTHVLVPLDGSPLADQALAHALAVFDCRLTVLNVVTPLDTDMSESGVLETEDDRKAAARDRADRLLARASERATTDDRTIDTAVETGDPAGTILEYVADHDVDHVVMGGHGGENAGIVRRLLGTVASTVVSEAPVSVTVVR